MGAAKIRTDSINTYSLKYQITGIISGTIIEVTRNQRGSPRYLIAPTKIKELNKSELPTFIRLSAASKHSPARPGDRISGLGRLQPISGPAYPGSFDFSFNSWYNGLGGSGFFMGKPKISQPDDGLRSLSWSLKFMISVNRLRT